MKKISIWLVPCDRDRKFLAKIIQDLAGEYASEAFVPHLTIYGSLDNIDSKQKYQLIESAVEKCIKDIKPFEMQIDKLNHTKSFNKTVFMEMKNNQYSDEILYKLKDRLSKIANYIFLPHISLIYKNCTEGLRKKIISEVELKIRNRNKFEFDEIMIVSPEKDDWNDIKSWKELASFDFK